MFVFRKKEYCLKTSLEKQSLQQEAASQPSEKGRHRQPSQRGAGENSYLYTINPSRLSFPSWKTEETLDLVGEG